MEKADAMTFALATAMTLPLGQARGSLLIDELYPRSHAVILSCRRP